MKRLSLILLILVAAAGFVLAEGTPEGEYPNKPIQLIVPWGAGGRTDINARMFASVAPKYLGQPVVVVNKAGGGSVIGGEFVANADPDGYTLIAMTPGTNVFPVIFKQAPYDTLDFDAIGQIGSSTMAIASKPDRPFSNARELITYAKSNPGEVTYACVALKAPQLGFLNWADKAGLEFKHVPVGNDAEAVEAALGGHVDIAMTSSVATIISHVNAKNLNALMVFAEKRDSNLPDTPTAMELGYNVVASPFTGIAAPKGLPPEVLQKLRTVFKQVIEDKDFITVMNRVGESLDPKFGDDFYAVWKNDKEGYGGVVEKMGLAQ
ncbi:MAG: tripartite tricarboxylate transporter substrate binding protein [Spirochaetaceae bacterium]|nr:MAG: tripartite tricarboxylate transporter substrate binding protein [Spirochaetaceae bacterium]